MMPTERLPGALAGAAGVGCADDRRSETTSHHAGPITYNAAAQATWGAPLAARRPRTIALVAWRPLVKGALRGFATVELPIGLKLIDCPVLLSSGKAWASLPSKPVLDRDGRQKIDANGKPTYAGILEWRSRELSERFSEAVVRAIRQAYPGAIDEGPQ
jgi:hypothetical protein